MNYFRTPSAYVRLKKNIYITEVHKGPFPSNMMRSPLILCFDLLPLQYTDLTHQIWREPFLGSG